MWPHVCKALDKIYLDLVGPLPESSNDNKSNFSMVDDLTKFVDFGAIPDQEASTMAKVLFDEIVSRYSLPQDIVTDQGANFTGLCVSF